MANSGQPLNPAPSNADMGDASAISSDADRDPHAGSHRQADTVDELDPAGNRGNSGKSVDGARTSSEHDVVPGISPAYDADPGHQSKGGYGGEDEYDDTVDANSDDQAEQEGRHSEE